MLRRPELWIALTGVAIAAALFEPLLATFAARTVAEDSLEVAYPLHTYEKNALLSGHFPHWNPYVQAGMTEAGSTFNDFLYPLHWLVYVFPMTFGINFLYLLHWFLGGCGAVLFFRTFASKTAAHAGAWIYVLSGPSVSFISYGYLGTLYALAMLPWCLWFLSRAMSSEGPSSLAWASTAGLLAAFSLSVMGTYTMMFIFIPACLYLACLPSRTGRWKLFGIFWLSAALVASARVIPWYLVVRLTPRIAADLTFSSAGSIHPAFLLNFFIPDVLPSLGVTGLELRGYRPISWPVVFGLAPALLAGRAMWREGPGRFLILMYGFEISLVFGIYSPVYIACHYLLPGFSLTSHPNIYLPVAAFAAAGMAAALIDGGWVCARPVRRTFFVAAGFVAAAAVLVLWLPVESRLLAHFLDHRAGFSPSNILKEAWRLTLDFSWPESRRAAELVVQGLGAGRFVWGVAILAAILAALRVTGGWRRTAAILMVLALDVGFHPRLSWDLARPEDYFKTTALHEKLAGWSADPSAEPFRVYPVGGPYNTPFFKFNHGCILGVESIKGEVGQIFRDLARYFNRVEGSPADPARRYAQLYGTMKKIDSRLLDLLNVRYLLSDTPLWDPDLRETAAAEGLWMYENMRALPRAFFSKRVEKLADPAAVFESIERSDYDPREVLYTARVFAPPQAVDTAASGRVSTRREGPNRMRLDVASPSGGWVMVSEAGVPGWTVVMDGSQRLDWLQVNNLFVAFAVPPGDHTINISYFPPGLAFGLALTALGAIGWMGLWVRAARFNARRRIGSISSN